MPPFDVFARSLLALLSAVGHGRERENESCTSVFRGSDKLFLFIDLVLCCLIAWASPFFSLSAFHFGFLRLGHRSQLSSFCFLLMCFLGRHSLCVCVCVWFG